MDIITRLNLWIALMVTFFAYHVTYGWTSIILVVVNVYVFGKIVYEWGYEHGKYESSYTE